LADKKRVLIIEDEEAIRNMLAYALAKEGFEVRSAADGADGLRQALASPTDLVLLDLMLPDANGFDLCRTLSVEHKIPIIMITARSEMVDKVLGMELGADDYITKPFDIREVIVRIRAIFRRIDQISETKEAGTEKWLRLGPHLSIARAEREVWLREERIALTHKEYELLLYLAEHSRRVFTRAELLDKVWGFDFPGDTRTVDIHVQRLRKKLDAPHAASIIETVFGVGYRLAAEVKG